MGDSDEEICGEEYSTKEGVCDQAPKYPDGKCGTHSDHTGDGGQPEGTTNNRDGRETHGISSDRSLYYERRSEADKAFIDGMIDTFLEDAPFDRDHAGKVEIVRQVAIDMHKRRKANEYIDQEGLKWEEVTDYYETENGDLKVVTETQEHYLNLAVDRIARTNLRQLKELDILDSPDSQQAEAGQTMVDILSGSDE